MSKAVRVTTPASAWEPNVQPEEHPRARLLATLSFGVGRAARLNMHVTALRATVKNGRVVGPIEAVEKEYAEWCHAAGADGIPQTIRIGDGEYFVFAEPFC